MLTRNDLQKLSQVRLDDATYLLHANRPSSAYYLAGYAVELALKACISRLILPNAIPDKAFINAIYVHKFYSLLATSGLQPEFDSDMRMDSEFAAYWAITNNWTEESRYEMHDQIEATSLIQAISEPNHGVFRWLKSHW